MSSPGKVERETEEAKALPGRRPKLTRVYTAWHPLLVFLLEHVLPEGWYQVTPELQLAREPLRVDVVIVRRNRSGAPPAPHLLTTVVGDLAEHTLVHFKGASDELERDDARMLLAYALQYLVVAGIEDPAQVALRVVAPRLPRRFVESLRSLGCEVTNTGAGTHEGRLLVFPLRLVEAVPVHARPGEHLLYTVTPGMIAHPLGIPALTSEEKELFWALGGFVEQNRHPLPGQRKRHMKDEDLVVDSFEKVMLAHIKSLPPELRLAGMAPEERLAGLAIEQRLAGLTEAEVLLAMPEAALRGLSEEYLATLPQETRAALKRRLGGAAGAKRAPARRKPRGRSG